MAHVDPLHITGKPSYDNRIVKMEMHAYNPYANASMGNSDEIRIPIQQQDIVTLPCESYLYVEGQLVEGERDPTAINADSVTLDNNCVAFMFDEIRYELNGVEIDRCKNVGISTCIKNYISFTADANVSLENAGWTLFPEKRVIRNFSFCVPMKLFLGFCEDYKRVVVNARHELVLIRARNDVNPIYSSVNIKNSSIRLDKLQWRMPHVTLNEFTKLDFLRIIEQDRPLTMAFRSWELYEYPLLPAAQKHTWAVKAATQLETPRFVVVALQTNRKTVQHKRVGVFDDCKLIDLKLYLNSEFYPYDKLNLDFTNDRYSVVYNMYRNFVKAYYRNSDLEPMFTMFDFKKYGPIFVIDCSHQNESIKSGMVDIKIEMEFKDNIPNDTAAYCLVIHDRLIEYNPLTSIVRKLS